MEIENVQSIVSEEFDTCLLKNKGFLMLDSLFKEHGWHIVNNDFNWITWSRKCFETEFFEVKLDNSTIYVSIPLKNSIFQYRTTFKSYFFATEYIEERFKEYISC